MHSVSSNAVSQCSSYSTEEVFTGSYWLDGKKIYRIVLRTTSAITTSYSWGGLQSQIQALNIAYAVKMFANSGNAVFTAVFTPSNGFKAITGTGIDTGSYIWLEYTKTTD